MKRKINLLFIGSYVLVNLISSSACYSRFDDDDYGEFGNSFADPHLDIRRNVKLKSPLTPHLNDHHTHKLGESERSSPEFAGDRGFKNDDLFKDPFKGESFRGDPFRNDVFKRPDSFKDDFFMKKDGVKTDFNIDFKENGIKSTEQPKIELVQPKPTDNPIHSSLFGSRKKEPKSDHFNKSESFLSEMNANFDDVSRVPDFDFHEHDSWFEQHRDDEHSDRPRSDRDKLIDDYRRPTPRTPFRVPMIPVPAFYPHPFPMLPTPFVPLQPMNRPQPQQQNQQQQVQNRPQRPSNAQAQQNSNLPNPAGGFYPYYPTFYPMMPVMPQSVPNSQGNAQNSQNANAQLQHALSNMMNRNSFLGFVDPLIIVAIIAIPVIAMLGFSSVVMPFIPVIIYMLNIFFPISAAAGRKKRSTTLGSLCLIFDDFENAYLTRTTNQKQLRLLYANKLSDLEISLRRLHRSVCKFHTA